jgi:hypothetical protein
LQIRVFSILSVVSASVSIRTLGCVKPRACLPLAVPNLNRVGLFSSQRDNDQPRHVDDVAYVGVLLLLFTRVWSCTDP